MKLIIKKFLKNKQLWFTKKANTLQNSIQR